MYYFTSTGFLITLFGYLSSLDFNNRIEILTLMTKFQGPPIFGGKPEAVPLLPPSRAGPDRWTINPKFLEVLIGIGGVPENFWVSFCAPPNFKSLTAI